jgi:hypothetical protein
MTDLKQCNTCAQEKAIDDFHRMTAARDGHRPECKSCTAARRKAWYERNREREIARVKEWQQENAERVNELQRRRRARPEVKARERAGHLKRKFGLTLEEYDEMLVSQGGRCAICCRKPRKVSLHVDHDPKSGRVRGLLCFPCNQALGSFGEKREIVASAANYLFESDPKMQKLATIARERALALRS